MWPVLVLFITLLTLTQCTPFNASLESRAGILSLFTPTGLQKDAPRELKVISQPEKVSPGDALQDYVYPSSSGSCKKKSGKTSDNCINVFIIDSGANPQHSFYTDLTARGIRPKWIYAFDDNSPSSDRETDLSGVGHGTCLASKAVSTEYGTAKDAQLWIVQTKPSAVSHLEAWQKVFITIRLEGLQGKAVVSYSHGKKNPGVLMPLVYSAIQKLILDNVVVVVAAGNNGKNVFDINTWPQRFAEKSDYGPGLPIIVVGSTNNDGKRSDFSQGGGLLTTSAPGERILCASNDGDQEQIMLTLGTSYAAPAVAGTIAAQMAVDKSLGKIITPGLQYNASGLPDIEGLNWKDTIAGKVKKWIQKKHYARQEGYPPMIWNGHAGKLYKPKKTWADIGQTA